jgi:hypothetical protein
MYSAKYRLSNGIRPYVRDLRVSMARFNTVIERLGTVHDASVVVSEIVYVVGGRGVESVVVRGQEKLKPHGI